MEIIIDNKKYSVKKEQSILDVCRENGIFIPSLCHHPDLLPAEGVCRLCLVKTNLHKGLTPSCQIYPEDGLEVITEDEEINKARKYILELLWADHAGKCPQCPRNGNCELQKLAQKIKIDINDFVPEFSTFDKEEQLKILKNSLKNRVVDDENPSIYRDNQYCIECRRCIRVCKNIQTIASYGMNYRSIESNVGTPGERPLDCIYCGQCSAYCPTAAIQEKRNIKQVEEYLEDSGKLTVFQVAPSVRFSLGEEFGLHPGEMVEGKIASALRNLGADLVFDTTFAADLTIVEEAQELLERIKKKAKGEEACLPMFTSCCPAWVLYLEKFRPEFLPHLSTCKSPQQMLGAMVKNYYAEWKKISRRNIAVISVMPCTAKKYEAAREELTEKGDPDVDAVITTRELASLIKQNKIKFSQLKDEKFDQALGAYSGAGIIFGSTGGVMEAALRTAYEKLTSREMGNLDYEQVRGERGIKEAEIAIPEAVGGIVGGITVRTAVAHEIGNAEKVLQDIQKKNKSYDFVEVMACPGGCLGGGGQPRPAGEEIRQKRRKAIYEKDKNSPIRKSHQNPIIQKLYRDYLGSPGGEIAEKLLHTEYFNKKQK
jgi:NADH-quinone oxidoreductase subunit G/[NiFe] hydrogenase diaphorase moiety small subunit/NADP-reducing hydrogenase subunit HndD